jgi:hypothetical protein
MYRYQSKKTLVLIALLISLTFISKCKKIREESIIKMPVKKHGVTGTARLGIKMLKSHTLDATQVKLITLKLYKRLLSIKGVEYIAFKEHDGSKLEITHTLTGSVNRLTVGYSLSVLVSDNLDGHSVYKRRSRVNEEIELEYMLNDIAERVVEKLW